MKRNRDNMWNYLIIVIITVFGLMLYKLNELQPLMADDFDYMYNLADKSKKISSIYDIYVSQKHHYFYWGGRSIAHSLAQFFLWRGKEIFNIFNTLVSVILLILIYQHTSKDKNNTKGINVILLGAIIYMMWLGVPNLGETMFWLIGSCNYLWTIVLVLLFLLPYRLKNKLQSISLYNRKYFTIFMFILGALSGWTNENIAVAIFIVLLGYGYIYISRNKYIQAIKKNVFEEDKLDMWQISGGIGFGLGTACLILAPGNYVRSQILAYNPTLSERVKNYITICWQIIMEQRYIWLVLILSCLVLLVRINHIKKYINKNLIIWCINFFLLWGLSMGAMLGSPTFPIRAAFGITIFLICFTMCILQISILGIGEKSKVVFFIHMLNIFIGMICINNYKNVYTGYCILNEQQKEREILVAQQENEETIIVPRLIDGTRYMFVNDATMDSECAWNGLYKSYYDVDTFVAIDRYIYDNVYLENNLEEKFVTVMNEESFNLKEDVSIEDIYLAKESKNKYVILIKLGALTDVGQLKTYNMAFSGYPIDEQSNKIANNRKKYGYENFDFTCTPIKINNSYYLIQRFQTKVDEFENFIFYLYNNTEGLIGDMLSISNIKLED